MEQVTWTFPTTSTCPEAWSTFPHPMVYICGHTWTQVKYVLLAACFHRHESQRAHSRYRVWAVVCEPFVRLSVRYFYVCCTLTHGLPWVISAWVLSCVTNFPIPSVPRSQGCGSPVQQSIFCFLIGVPETYGIHHLFGKSISPSDQSYLWSSMSSSFQSTGQSSGS